MFSSRALFSRTLCLREDSIAPISDLSSIIEVSNLALSFCNSRISRSKDRRTSSFSRSWPREGFWSESFLSLKKFLMKMKSYPTAKFVRCFGCNKTAHSLSALTFCCFYVDLVDFFRWQLCSFHGDRRSWTTYIAGKTMMENEGIRLLHIKLMTA